MGWIWLWFMNTEYSQSLRHWMWMNMDLLASVKTHLSQSCEENIVLIN